MLELKTTQDAPLSHPTEEIVKSFDPWQKKVDAKAGEKCTYEWKIRDGKGCETKKGGSAALTPVPQPSVEAKAVPVKAAAKVTRQLIQPVVFESFTVSDR